jgi:REP element-mobilizing transposase RayT
LIFDCTISIVLYNHPMLEYRRALIAGGTFFFTVVTYKWQPILTSPEARPILRAAIWQRRFWEHTIRDLDDFNCHLNYIN